MLSYPVNCITPAERTEYCYRAQELLRLIHNIFSKWYRTGLTQAQYSNIPTKIQIKYPYKDQLTQAEWHDFHKNDFMPRSQKICTQINIQRAELKSSTNWDIAVEDI